MRYSQEPFPRKNESAVPAKLGFLRRFHRVTFFFWHDVDGFSSGVFRATGLKGLI